MVVPPGLVVFICVLIGGFGISYGGLIRKMSSETKYEVIGGAGTIGNSTGPGPILSTSYQNPASVDYAISTQPKDVTYCVIDGRLVDQ